MVINRLLSCSLVFLLIGVHPALTEEHRLQGFGADRLIDIAIEEGKVQLGLLALHKSEVVWDSEGRVLIVTLPNKAWNRPGLVKIDLETGNSVAIADDGMGAKLSPNGRFLGYVGVDGALRILAKQNGEFEPVAELPTGLSESQLAYNRIALRYDWAPDSSGIAFVRAPDLNIEGSDHFARTGESELRFLNLESGVEERLYSSGRDINSLSFGPSGRLYFSNAKEQEHDGAAAHGLNVQILFLDKGSREVVALTEDIGNVPSIVRPSASPDGRYVAYNHSLDPGYLNYPVRTERAFLDVTSGERHILTDTPYSTPFGGASLVSWTGAGKTLSYKCKPGVFWNTICLTTVESGVTEKLQLEEMGNIGGFAFSPDGKQIAWVSRDLTDTIRVKVARADGADTKTVYQQARTDLSNTAVGEARTVRWKSYDGLEIEGLLTLPVGYEEGTRVPMIVDIHGGPHGGVAQDGSLLVTSPLEWQMWAAKGYAVFAVDYRNSQISGRDWSLFIRPPAMMISEPDAKDVLAGVDHLITEGYADSARIAAIGHSHGSMVLNTLLTLTDRFAVAVSKEGLSDHRYRSSDPSDNPLQYRTTLFMKNATPATMSRVFAESSPVVYGYRIKTPLLFIRAGSGPEYSEIIRNWTYDFVNAVNEGGGTAEALFFADDLHVIMEEKNARIMVTKTIEWIDRYIGPASSVSAPGEE